MVSGVISMPCVVGLPSTNGADRSAAISEVLPTLPSPTTSSFASYCGSAS